MVYVSKQAPLFISMDNCCSPIEGLKSMLNRCVIERFVASLSYIDCHYALFVV